MKNKDKDRFTKEKPIKKIKKDKSKKYKLNINKIDNELSK